MIETLKKDMQIRFGVFPHVKILNQPYYNPLLLVFI